MLKRFCDVCKKEITHEPDRYCRAFGLIKIEVFVAYKGNWNAGDICQECITKAVNEGHKTEPEYGRTR